MKYNFKIFEKYESHLFDTVKEEHMMFDGKVHVSNKQLQGQAQHFDRMFLQTTRFEYHAIHQTNQKKILRMPFRTYQEHKGIIHSPKKSYIIHTKKSNPGMQGYYTGSLREVSSELAEEELRQHQDFLFTWHYLFKHSGKKQRINLWMKHNPDDDMGKHTPDPIMPLEELI